MIDSNYLREAEGRIRADNKRISSLLLGRKTDNAHKTTIEAIRYAANVVRDLTTAGFSYPTLKQPLRNLRGFGQRVGMNGNKDFAYINSALEGTESRRIPRLDPDNNPDLKKALG